MISKALSFVKREVSRFIMYSINFISLVIFVVFVNLVFIFLTTGNYENASFGMVLFAFLAYLVCYYKFSSFVVKNNDIKKFLISISPILFAFFFSVGIFFIVSSIELSGFIALVLLVFYLLYLFIVRKL